MLGVVFTTRHERNRERQAGSLTELASVHGLVAQIERLKQDTRRLRRERDELLDVLTRLGNLLERCGAAAPALPRTIPRTINSEAIEFFVQASDIPA